MPEYNDEDVLLKVNNLKKYFPIRGGVFQRVVGEVKAVDDISFYVNNAETVGLVGESGCGKTTTARTIVRAYEATDGEILFKDGDEFKDIVKMEKDELKYLRREIQMIYQDPYGSLNPRMTVLDIISEPLVALKIGNKKARVDRVKELLPQVNLKVAYMNRYPHAFSGGQRQRIGIARALAPNPKFIVADEPVSALDVSVQAQVLNLLMDLQEEFGITFLFIAHDLSVVKHICDRIAVMYAGKLVELADTQELFTSPQHPYPEALLSSIPTPNPREKINKENLLSGTVADAANPPSGCNFHPRCRYAVDVCSKEEPTLTRVADDNLKDHWVACHRAQELSLKGEDLTYMEDL